MADKNRQIRNSTAEFLIFTNQAGEDGIEVMVQDETVWLTQKMIAALFGSTKQNIGQHLKKIFEEGELLEISVVKKFFTTAADGKNYDTTFYNLDAIIACGYRINSVRATQFRQLATAVLRDFAIRGYVLDKERMKNGNFLSKEYFESNRGAGVIFLPKKPSKLHITKIWRKASFAVDIQKKARQPIRSSRLIFFKKSNAACISYPAIAPPLFSRSIKSQTAAASRTHSSVGWCRRSPSARSCVQKPTSTPVMR